MANTAAARQCLRRRREQLRQPLEHSSSSVASASPLVSIAPSFSNPTPSGPSPRPPRPKTRRPRPSSSGSASSSGSTSIPRSYPPTSAAAPPASTRPSRSGPAPFVAESYARIFFRNSVATGEVYPIELAETGAWTECRTGDVVTVDLDKCVMVNRTSGKEYKLKPIGDVGPVIESGGICAYVRKRGMIASGSPA